MDIDTLEGLMRCPLFNGIQREDIIHLMHTVKYRIVRYSKGEIFTMDGAPCSHADIIIEGEMSAKVISPSGRIIQMGMHHSGNMLAPAFLYSLDNRYPVKVEALTDAVIFRLSPDNMEILIHANANIRMNFIRILSNIVSFLTKKVRMLSMTIDEKIGTLLTEMRKEQGSDRIVLPYSRQKMAEYLGIQKYSLQRGLNELQKRGEIIIEGKYITILNK